VHRPGAGNRRVTPVRDDQQADRPATGHRGRNRQEASPACLRQVRGPPSGLGHARPRRRAQLDRPESGVSVPGLAVCRSLCRHLPVGEVRIQTPHSNYGVGPYLFRVIVAAVGHSYRGLCRRICLRAPTDFRRRSAWSSRQGEQHGTTAWLPSRWLMRAQGCACVCPVTDCGYRFRLMPRGSS